MVNDIESLILTCNTDGRTVNTVFEKKKHFPSVSYLIRAINYPIQIWPQFGIHLPFIVLLFPLMLIMKVKILTVSLKTNY